VGNGKILSDIVQSFSTHPYRRVDLVAPLDHGVDVRADTALLEGAADPVLAVSPYCHNDDCRQVDVDTNRTIREAFGEAGFPVPEQHVFLRNAP
jgi:small conductance mechanosensitive channel